MGERQTVVVRRRSARAILIDDDGHLVLIRRTRPGRAPYWTTAGGGVEDGRPRRNYHDDFDYVLGQVSAPA